MPLAESVPEKELELPEEPAASEQASIAKAEEPAATEQPAAAEMGPDEAAEDTYADPFAGEKFPRIPIKTDKRLRQAEEAELAKIQVEPAAKVEQPLPAEEPLQQEPLADKGAVSEETAAAEAEQEQPAATEEEPALAEEEPAQEAVTSVTTKRHDKLWNIAKSMRPDESVTLYQVMMALLQSNPDAFVDGNVHRLKVGKVLRIDDPSLLTAMSRQQAAQEYIAQTRAWEDYRQQLASSRNTPMQPEVAGEAKGAAPTTEVLPEDVPAKSSGELVLSAPEGDNQTAGSSGDQKATVNNEVVILREEIRQALAEAKAEGSKNVVLNEKLRDLESQLQNLQRSVTVKDDELATLQKQLSDLNKKNLETEQAEAEAETKTETQAQAEAPAAPAEIPAVDRAVESSEKGAVSESELAKQQEAQQQAAAEQAAPQTTTPPQATEPTQAQDTGPGMLAKVFGVLDSIKQTLSGMMSSLPISPMILVIGGGVIVVLLLLMVLLVQRRRQAANFQESILSGLPSHEIMASEDASLETNLSGESSFLSDFAISGASALQGDDGDVDPLTEADVFMAYGRYEAAEERILEAIKKDPDRQELRIKLLELYNTTKNKTAFESAAEEMYANLGHDASNPLWQKVVVMGAMLAPDNPLFSDTAGSDVTRIRPTEDVTRIRNVPPATEDADMLDFGFDENKPAETMAEPSVDDLGLDLDFAMDNTEDDHAAFDFDLDSSGEDTAQVENTGSLDFKLDSDESLQLDTSGLDFELPADETAEVGSAELDLSLEETAETEAALNFDADLTDNKTAQPELDNALDFDLGGIEGEATAMDLQLDENDQSSMGLTLDMDVDTAVAGRKDDGRTMEMSQPTFSDIEMPTMEAEVDATDIAELDTPSVLDEVGTKLDLARAYIDMGDPDGARSILDEVLEEGSPPQQQEAQALMQQI